MRHPLRLLLAALVVTALAVVVMVAVAPTEDKVKPARDEPFTTTPLEGFETTTVTVPRAEFCSSVDPRQVEAALGGEPVDAQGYDNGDKVSLTDGVTDVAHEFGCTWTGSDSTEARAWVFAPPVGQARAQLLVKEAGRAKGCQASPTPAYGSPSVGLVCTGDDGRRAAYQGLFGDAWLTCELSLDDPEVSETELAERAGAWCVGVVMGASAG